MATEPCTHLDQIRDVKPHTRGCEECLKMGDTWVHLRLCLTCGHVGCCDSSPAQHATAHFRETGHPVVQSFEPGEDWFWDYQTNQYYDGPDLAPPESRPSEETTPGPRGRVPGDWVEILRNRAD